MKNDHFALLRGLEATHAVHLRFICKFVVDFLFMLIELFLLGCYSWGAASECRLENSVFTKVGNTHKEM